MDKLVAFVEGLQEYFLVEIKLRLVSQVDAGMDPAVRDVLATALRSSGMRYEIEEKPLYQVHLTVQPKAEQVVESVPSPVATPAAAPVAQSTKRMGRPAAKRYRCVESGEELSAVEMSSALMTWRFSVGTVFEDLRDGARFVVVKQNGGYAIHKQTEDSTKNKIDEGGL